jgi:hypothetical protein
MVIEIESQYAGSTMRPLIPVLACICLAKFASAQADEFQRNHITVGTCPGTGPAIPLGNAANYVGAAPLLSVVTGYRFTRFLQADVGFHVAFGAATNRTAELTGLGQVHGGNHDYMTPLGGRYVIPSPLKLMEFSAGRGGIYRHYSKTLPLDGWYSSECCTCLSRGDWGSYGPRNASYFFGDGHNFHVGTTYEFVAASTDGQAVGYVPDVRTSDHWSNLFLEFGFRF